MKKSIASFALTFALSLSADALAAKSDVDAIATEILHKIGLATRQAEETSDYHELSISPNMVGIYDISHQEDELYNDPELRKILHTIELLNIGLKIHVYILDKEQGIFKFDIEGIDEVKYYIIKPPEFHQISEKDMQELLRK